ncbi:MAG: adenylate kinase family protein [Candidatus Micrarchaeota archaeon]
MVLLITGTPGTGKSTLAAAISLKVGWEHLDANAIVEEKKLWSRVEQGARIVDMGKLSRALAPLIKKNRDVVIEGHLLCDIELKSDYIVVLRTNPHTLRKRLTGRGYSKEKVDENVLAEALDYCTIESESRYPTVYEVDTTDSKTKSLRHLMQIFNGKGKRFHAGRINWSKELEELAVPPTIT